MCTHDPEKLGIAVLEMYEAVKVTSLMNEEQNDKV